MIRAASFEDVLLLPAVERRAGELFRAAGMGAVADDPPPSVQELLQARTAHRLWVVVGADDHPVGYVRTAWVDDCPHLEQVTVDPAHSRQGYGRALMARVEEWARAGGGCRMTLTTYAEVPWNGPYYRRLGWHVLAPAEWGPELARVRAREAALGFDAWPRAAMAKDL